MDANSVQGVRADISEMLSKIRDFSAKNTSFPQVDAPRGLLGASAPQNFSQVLDVAKGAVNSVNQIQQESSMLQTSYLNGDSNVSMSQVIVAAQKSKLAFEGLIAVRNKILDAYTQIMSMSV